MARKRALKSALLTPVKLGRTTTWASLSSSVLMLLPMMLKVCSNICSIDSAWLPSGVVEMSTANTTSAPISRA